VGYDFDGVARAALAAGETLLPRWIGGKRVGHEWVGERTRNGGIGDSWSINLHNGKWRHFAGSESGSDIISFYAAVFHVDMGAAFHAVQGALGGASSVPVLPMRSHDLEPESKADPIPEDAPALTDHPDYGPATATYRYGDRFVVTRYDFTDGEGHAQKIFAQWTWRRGKWAKQGPGSNRPLYHAHEFAKDAGARVLVVEGEKCVEAARRVLSGFTVTTWAGGAQAWRHSDWSPLAGRDVIIWPDADPVGRQAAAELAASLASSVERVRIVNPNGADPGWDVADAIQKDGWDAKRLAEFMTAHFAEPALPAPIPRVELLPTERGIERESLETDGSPSAALSYLAMGLDCDGNDRPFVTLANASLILQRYERFKNHIWFDEFRGQVYHTLRSPIAQPWTDRETRAVTVAIQQQLKLPKFHMDLIRNGITHAAECNARHSLTNWLDSLSWDGTERLETWLFDCAGVDNNDYTMAVARNWLIAMIARAYKPGCKMDNMPVLEGVSGLNKTQFLEILGGEWYEAVPTEFGTKDFLQNIKGVWLAEIPDMTGFNRADHSTVISMLTIRFDKYRKAYGYESERHPRTTIFAATSETDDYVGDSRGKRRYWPIRCTDINLDSLRGQRDQLFAEAVVHYRENAKWYEMPTSALGEQSDRVTDDPWIRLISNYVNPRWEQMRLRGDTMRIHMDEILTEGVRLLPGQQGIKEARRAGSILRSIDWVVKHTDAGNFWRKRERKTQSPLTPI
jgi:hypothetical protein